MTATQEHLLKLMLEIDEICKKHDIEFFLDYGTALGAVRHGGFIPWDNDLDIAMTEENYNKFREVCNREVDTEKRIFLDNRMDRDFPQVFGHYIDLEAFRPSKVTAYWTPQIGQWIDIFCVVDLPNDFEGMKNAIGRYNAYDEVVNRSFRHCRWKNDEIMRWYRELEERIEKEGKEKVLQEFEAEFFGNKYENAEWCLRTTATGCNPGPYFPKSFITPLREVEYEGYKVKIPGDYVGFLLREYGDDYNMLPDERMTHREMSHTSLPSRVYVDDYMRVLDGKTVKKNLSDFKEEHMLEGERATELVGEFNKAQEVLLRNRIIREIEKNKYDIHEMMDSGNAEEWEKLDKLFSQYYTKQGDGACRSWQTHIGIGDELEEIAIELLLRKRNNKKTLDTIFSTREFHRLPLTERMQKVKFALDQLREARKGFEYKEYDRVKNALELLGPEYGELADVKLYRLRYSAETTEDSKKLAKIAEELEAMIKNKDEDSVRMLLGDVLWKQGRKKDAEEHFRILKDRTKDGIIIRDILRREAE